MKIILLILIIASLGLAAIIWAVKGDMAGVFGLTGFAVGLAIGVLSVFWLERRER